MKIYLIKWLDAWSQGAGWDDPPKQDGTLCETVGFLIDETKDMLTVEQQFEDVPRDMDPYTDTNGNSYDFSFGLNWSGVIDDERTQAYK